MKRETKWNELGSSTPPDDIAVLLTDGDVIVTGRLKTRDGHFSDERKLVLDRPAVGTEWLTHWMLPELPAQK